MCERTLCQWEKIHFQQLQIVQQQINKSSRMIINTVLFIQHVYCIVRPTPSSALFAFYISFFVGVVVSDFTIAYCSRSLNELYCYKIVWHLCGSFVVRTFVSMFVVFFLQPKRPKTSFFSHTEFIRTTNGKPRTITNRTAIWLNLLLC